MFNRGHTTLKGLQIHFWRDSVQFSSVQFSSVQLLSCVWLFATPWIAARQASLSITNSRSLLKLMPIESVMPSSHLILCRPLLLPPEEHKKNSMFNIEAQTYCISFLVLPNHYHKLGSLKQTKWILSQSGGQKSEIKVLVGLCSIPWLQRRILPASGGAWCPLAYGHLSPVSVSVFFKIFI